MSRNSSADAASACAMGARRTSSIGSRKPPRIRTGAPPPPSSSRYRRIPSRAFVAYDVRVIISVTYSAMFGGLAARVRAQQERPVATVPPDLTGRRPVSTSSRVVSSHATAFVEARRFVRESVGPVPRRIVDDAILLTSELVTNAVRHAGHDDQDEIEVTVSV